MADYDLAIIGGGLNGTSLARDAAGRGLRVILLEQGDLGGAASSASSRFVHGDFPAQFAFPVHADERPPWLLRSSLWLYDRLASKSRLPPSATLDVTHHPIGNA